MRPVPIDEKGGVLVIQVGDASSLNEGQASSLRQALYAAVASRPLPRIAVDLSEVDYVSSTGIALLIGAKRRVDAAEGRLVLFGLHPDIVELFHSMKLNALFDLSDNEDRALERLSASPTS